MTLVPDWLITSHVTQITSSDWLLEVTLSSWFPKRASKVFCVSGPLLVQLVWPHPQTHAVLKVSLVGLGDVIFE